MNYHKKQILFMFVILAYVFTAIHMNSCYVSCNFQKGKEKGLYPDTSDFPNSKWNCKESEICFSILDYGESTIIGTYKEKDTTYRLVANFSFYAPELDFTLYSSTSEWESHYQDQDGIFYTHCERQILGTVYTNYVYRQGELICTVRGSDSEQFTENQQLTFQQEADYKLTVQNCYVCPDLKMEIESFEEIDGYYKGKIEIDSKICRIQFFEIGNKNYYVLSMENGTTNQLKEDTSSNLITMTLTQKDEMLIAHVTDDFFLSPQYFPEWKVQDSTFEFVKSDSTLG